MAVTSRNEMSNPEQVMTWVDEKHSSSGLLFEFHFQSYDREPLNSITNDSTASTHPDSHTLLTVCQIANMHATSLKFPFIRHNTSMDLWRDTSNNANLLSNFHIFWDIKFHRKPAIQQLAYYG